jgi:site-specific DNA recombinase
LLSNPIYLGRIRHKEVTYEGQHPIWDQVQAQLQSSARRTRGRRTDRSVTLLRGKIFDNEGHPMTPTYTPKANGRRYRYYVSQAVLKHGRVDSIEVPRIAGEVIDQWVMRIVREKLSASADCNVSERIRRVVLRAKEIEVELDSPEKGSDESIAATTIRVPVNLCRRGQEVQILTCDGTPNEAAPAPDPVLVGAMIRAYRWGDLLESGAAKSVEWISRTEHVNASYLAKLLSLAYLAPDLTDEILNGTQPRQLMLKHIRELDIPLDWQAKRRLFARFRA